MIPDAQERPSAVTALANAATAPSGLEAHDQAALQQIFAGSTVYSKAGHRHDHHSIQRADFGEGIDEWFMRLRASLEHQTIRPAVFERQRLRLLENIKNSRDNLGAEIGRRGQALMTPADPVVLPPSPAHIERLSVSGLQYWLTPLLQGRTDDHHRRWRLFIGDGACSRTWLGSLPTRSWCR